MLSPRLLSKATACYFQSILPHSFIGRDSEKQFLGHLLHATLILTFVISSKYRLSFFFKAVSAPQNNSPVMILHQFVELFSGVLVYKVQQPLNNTKPRFECFPIAWAGELRNTGVTCFISLLREWCLEFLSSLELVTIFASVFVGVVFILLYNFSLIILCKGLAALLSFFPGTERNNENFRSVMIFR